MNLERIFESILNGRNRKSETYYKGDRYEFDFENKKLYFRDRYDQYAWDNMPAEEADAIYDAVKFYKELGIWDYTKKEKTSLVY